MQQKQKNAGTFRTVGPVLAALVIIAIAAGVFLVQKCMPTREHMPTEDYFGTLAENELAVVLQDHLAEQRAVLYEDSLYLNYDQVREELNSRFFWDEENQQMLLATSLELYEIPVNASVYTIDGAQQSCDEAILLERNGTLYLLADFVQQFTNVEYTLEPETSHVLIRNRWGLQKTSAAKKTAAVRYMGGIKSPILTELEPGTAVYVLDELEKWLRVVTPDGYIGYVKRSRMEEVQETEITRDFEEEEYSSLHLEEPVNLVWHQIDNYDSNTYLTQDIEKMTGVNVISPTWYSLTDNEGGVASYASEEYARKAHAAGLDIWALINNFSNSMDTTTMLSSTKARRKVIDYLVEDALRLGIEGINLDFEYIREEAVYSYAQFVRELSIACRKNNLVFSIDVPEPFDFNLQYSYEELGTVADYVILMGYDEHYVGSDPGSVASLSFEENGILRALELVPGEKLISGVPFYTRIWYTADNGDGTTTVNSEAISMTTVDRTLETYQVTPSWNEETQQDYAVWTSEDGVKCEIWIENEKSLAKKARLVGNYQLGGIAAWRLGNEKETIWKILTDNIGGGEPGTENMEAGEPDTENMEAGESDMDNSDG